jgi:transcriptional regulator with XRE-family HTH domain
MPRIDAKEVAPLVRSARYVLGLTQTQLGELLHVARRTVNRWDTGSRPTVAQVVTLAKAVHARNPALASALAKAAGTRLEELGLGPPAPPPLPAPWKELAIHSIVGAAAEASVTTPQAIRAGLRAALERAAALGVSVDELRAALLQ